MDGGDVAISCASVRFDGRRKGSTSTTVTGHWGSQEAMMKTTHDDLRRGTLEAFGCCTRWRDLSSGRWCHMERRRKEGLLVFALDTGACRVSDHEIEGERREENCGRRGFDV